MVIGDYASQHQREAGPLSPFHSTIIFQRASTNEMIPTGNEFHSETLFEIEAQTLSIQLLSGKQLENDYGYISTWT